MNVKLLRKSGHKFFVFTNDGINREVCVDGWINSKVCPPFCSPSLCSGWESYPADKSLSVVETLCAYTVVCPTCFGYITSRGLYRKTGAFHMNLVLDKTGLNQFLYNYISL